MGEPLAAIAGSYCGTRTARLYFGFGDVMPATIPAVPAPRTVLEDYDPLAPQREAAMFYGLFLRGHSAEALRRDIDLPKKLVDKLILRHRNEAAVQERLNRVYQYRKQVLAIFDELVTKERTRERVH